MEWIILFIKSFILFFALVDWKMLKLNFLSGLVASLLQLVIDSLAISHHLYKINDAVLTIFGSSLFFVFGPVFVIGTLLAQFCPIKKWATIANVLIISALFSLEELFLLITKSLVYLNWHYFDSVSVNIISMVFLSLFSIVILNKNRRINK